MYEEEKKNTEGNCERKRRIERNDDEKTTNEKKTGDSLENCTIDNCSLKNGMLIFSVCVRTHAQTRTRTSTTTVNTSHNTHSLSSVSCVFSTFFLVTKNEKRCELRRARRTFVSESCWPVHMSEGVGGAHRKTRC